MTDQKQVLSRRTVVGGLSAAAVAGSFGLFAGDAQAAGPKVRSDIASTAGKKMLALYKKAAGLMAPDKKKEWDPQSWYFQANIHCHPYLEEVSEGPSIAVTEAARAIFTQPGATAALRTLALGADGTGSDGIWNTCSHHRDYAEHFLSWHRLYLYHFENVVQSVLGETFAMPYWNYTDPAHPEKRKLPVAFAKPAAGVVNPLHYADRDAEFLRLGLRVEDIRAKATLRDRTYLDPNENQPGFNTDIDSQPHGQVHVRIGAAGKGMQTVENAARDPIFWVHHAQIDRLWESWRRPRISDGLSPDRDPTDQAWLDKEFTFTTPGGTPSTMQARKALKMRQELGYTYDKLQNVKLVTLAVAQNDQTGAIASTTLTQSAPNTAATISAKEVPVAVDITPALATDAAKAIIRKPSSQFTLVIGVEATKNPGCVYDVFLKVKPSLNAPATEERFIETFNLFGAMHAGHGHRKPITWRADITDLVRASKFDPTAPGQIIVKCRFTDPIGPAVIKSVTVQAR